MDELRARLQKEPVEEIRVLAACPICFWFQPAPRTAEKQLRTMYWMYLRLVSTTEMDNVGLTDSSYSNESKK